MVKLPVATGCGALLALLGWMPAVAAAPPDAGYVDNVRAAQIVDARTLTGVTTWSGDIRVTGPVVVPPDAVLTVEVGARVIFDLPEDEVIEPDTGWITVRGIIRAEGSEAAPVVFVPARPRLNGLENMVDVREAREARFRHCEFRQGPWGLQLHDSPAVVEWCLFRDNYGGVRGRGGEIVLRANRFESNRIGVRLWRASPVIDGNTFAGNLTGLFFRQEVVGAVVRHNDFDDVEYGIKLGELQSADVDASNNWWGAVDPIALGQMIFDGADSDGVGRVLVEPRLAGPRHPEEPL